MKKRRKKSSLRAKRSNLKKETASAPSVPRNDQEAHIVFPRPTCLRDVENHYCAGCGHGIVHRLVCEVVDELGIREDVIAVAPVGCAVLAYEYWDFDVTEAAHGRTSAVATGIKRVRPDNIVFTYQGDGDLAAIYLPTQRTISVNISAMAPGMGRESLTHMKKVVGSRPAAVSSRLCP